MRVLFSIGRIFKSYCSFSLVLIIRLKRIRNVISAVMAAAQAIPMRAMAAKENSIGNNITVRILAEIYPIARIWISGESKEKRNPAKRPKSPAGKRQSYFQAIKDRRERRREYFISLRYDFVICHLLYDRCRRKRSILHIEISAHQALSGTGRKSILCDILFL